jgi:hypothetical protein
MLQHRMFLRSLKENLYEIDMSSLVNVTIALANFYEDDMLPFLLRSLNILYTYCRSGKKTFTKSPAAGSEMRHQLEKSNDNYTASTFRQAFLPQKGQKENWGQAYGEGGRRI